MASIKVILKKNKGNSQGEFPLYLRIIKDGKASFFSLGYKIKEKDWNEVTSTVKKSYPNSAYMNNLISTSKLNAENNALEQEKKSKFVPVKSIKQAILGKNSISFFEFTTSYMAKVKPKVSIGTYTLYETVINKVTKFVGKKGLMLNEVTPLFLDNFETYLRETCKNGQNTIHANFKILRRFILAAINDELIQYEKNPFLKRKYFYEKTNIEFLTEDELSLLENHQYDEKTIKFHVRNLFVFACYAGGLRVSDLLLLTWSKFDGERILLSTKKTNTTVSIKLLTKALEIINIYKPEKPIATDLVFPLLKNFNISTPDEMYKSISLVRSKIDIILKQIAKDVELKKHLHMHMSRHTFATRALKKGMRIEYVSKLLGHASIKTTQVYASIVNEDLDNAMELLN